MDELQEYYNYNEIITKENFNITGWIKWFSGFVINVLKEIDKILTGVLSKRDF
jgi:hypothetical protein